MSKLLFSFGVITDCQYADKDNATMLSSDERHVHECHYRQSLGKLDEAIEFFNTQQLEFVVHLGDFVDGQVATSAPAILAHAEKSHAPLWHVLGNHEYTKLDCDEAEILRLYGLESPYYSRVVAGHRFIVLDTNEMGVIKHAKDTAAYAVGEEYLQKYIDAGVPQAKPWNGGVSDVQLQWLGSEIDEAKASGQRAIVFAHHPVFPPNGANALNDNDVLATLDQHAGVIAFMNGHNHFGAVGVRGDIPYVTMPAVLEGDTNAYAVAHVYDDTIELVSYGRAQDVRLPLRK